MLTDLYIFIILRYLAMLIVPILIILLIVYLVRMGLKKPHLSPDKKSYMQSTLLSNDIISQLFLLFSFFFLGETFFALNKNLGDPISWSSILFIVSIIGLIGSYYLKTFLVLIFSLWGLGIWWIIQAAQWASKEDIKTSVILSGLMFLALTVYSIGRLHQKRAKFKRFAFVYIISGIIAITGALFYLSTNFAIFTIEAMTKGVSFFNSWQITLSLFIFLILLIMATLYAAKQKLVAPSETIAVFFVAFLFGIIALLPEQKLFANNLEQTDIYWGRPLLLSSSGLLWIFVFNLLIFLKLIGLIIVGYLRSETWLINLGTILLVLLIIAKYFDWFFRSLDKILLFFGAGILFLVIGWLMERGRRYMISNIKPQPPQIQEDL